MNDNRLMFWTAVISWLVALLIAVVFGGII